MCEAIVLFLCVCTGRVQHTERGSTGVKVHCLKLAINWEPKKSLPLFRTGFDSAFVS